MATGTITDAHTLLVEGVAALGASRTAASGDELLAVLTTAEDISRRVDVIAVQAVADLQRQGVFVDKGYRSVSSAVGELLGVEYFDARLRATAAEQVCSRIGLDGGLLPPRLPATAGVFAAAEITLRHVDVIAKVLATPAAGRLDLQVWAAVEAELADKAPLYTPKELRQYGTTMVEKLDQDGAEPEDGDAPKDWVNELRITPHEDKAGGTIHGRFDSGEMFAAIAAAIDAKSAPLTADDDRTAPRRQAEALVDICGYVLNHGDVPDVGGQRPNVNVIIDLEDLENRARAAVLDFGGKLTPGELRLFACDSGIIPIILGGRRQPLDVGRASRNIPIAIRRAVAARDRGCARPGCDRPVSWCEIHHVTYWENGGETKVDNCVILCRAHHRDMHYAGWAVKIVGGIPEFYPPAWIDPLQRPRRKPPPVQ